MEIAQLNVNVASGERDCRGLDASELRHQSAVSILNIERCEGLEPLSFQSSYQNQVLPWTIPGFVNPHFNRKWLREIVA